MSRVPAGRYQVEFAGAFGCHNPGNWLSQWYRGVTSPFPNRGVVVRVASGKVTRGIDASLRRGAQISGLVTSRAGKPLRGICVTVQGRVAGGFTEATPGTGKHGRYVVHGVFKGRYIVSFSIGCGNSGNFAPQWWRHAATQRAATPIPVAGTRKLASVDAVLDPGSAIAGVVRASGPAGPPLRGICVDANSRTGISAHTRTGKTGRYTLSGLAAGTYTVQYQADCGNRGNYLQVVRTVAVRAGRTRRNVDVFLQRGAAVTGTVTNTKGKALGGICVLIDGANGGSEADTNPDGSYSATGLFSGKYTVQFSADCGNTGSYLEQYYNGEPTALTADPVTLTAGHVTTGVDATMQPGGTVTGILTDSAGHPLSGVCVGIASLSDELFGDGTFTDIEFTSNGSFRAQNLSPGTYRVNFGCGIGPSATQWFRSRPSTASANLVSVPAGQVTSGISGILRPSGTITGTITDQAGRLLSGICVIAVPVGDPYPALIGGPGTRVSRHGLYRIGHLAAGRYDLQFSSCRGGQYGSQWYAGTRTQGSGTPVSVRFGHVTAGIDARMRRGGTISGRIVTSAGQPAARYCVQAFDAATESFALAFTDRTGRYTIRGLSSGSYQMFISSCRGSAASTTRPGLVRVVAPRAVTGIDERTPAGGSLSGTVLAGSPTADPQFGTCVLILPVQHSGSFGFINTAANGRYRVTGLVPGSYQVSFGDPFCAFLADPNLAPQWFDDQPTQAAADQVTVTAHAQTGGVDATLKENGAISGLVTDDANAPVPGECVIAFPLSAMPDPFLGEVQQPEIAVTGNNGSYTLAGMQPGRYKVKFTAGCGDSGFRTQWWDGAASAAAATVITVGAGGTVQGIDATLPH